MSYQFEKAFASAIAALKEAGAEEVYIFGSGVIGKISERSDIDLAVSGLPPQRFFKALSVASRLLERPLDLIDLDEVTPFTRYLKEEGALKRVG